MATFNPVEEIFGKDPSTDISQLPLLTPEQQQALQDLIEYLGSPTASEGVGRQLDLTSLQALEDLSRQFAQPGGGPLAPANEALTQLLGGASGDVADFDQFFQEAIADPLLRQFEEDIRPGITRQFAESGFRGSDRLLQESRGVEDLVQALTQSRAQLGFTARENAMNRALQAVGLAPSLAGAPVEIQNLINSASRRSEQQRVADLLAALGVRGFENLVQVNPGQQGALSTFIQNIAAAAGSYYGGGGGLSAQTPNNNQQPNIGLSNLNALSSSRNPFVLQ